MKTIFEKKWFIVFCWVGFLVTFGAGIGLFAFPEQAAAMLNIPFPATGFNHFFPRMMSILLLPFGLAYLFAVMDPDASRSLLMVATCEKVLAVLYALAAFFSGTVNAQIFGVVVGDGALALIGIYAVVNFSRLIHTVDQGEDEDEGEEEYVEDKTEDDK
jgi:hypothetical protein